MIKRLIGITTVVLASTSMLLAGAVTNTVKWNVPWGDRYRERSIETLDDYETQINKNATGDYIPLASNKVFIGNGAGIADEKTLSGLFSITTSGVASATTTGAGVTGVATTVATVLNSASIASEIDVLDSITPTTAAAITAIGAYQTDDVVTEYASPTTELVVTNTILQYSGTLYDSTGAALTNALGVEVSIITNQINEYGTVLVSLGAATTIQAVTNRLADTTGDFIDAITSNVVQAAKTLSTTTDDVIDSVTPTTATFVQP